jgi:hypothetical protein
LAGNVGRALDRHFASAIGETTTRDSYGNRGQEAAVIAFLSEYQTDQLFSNISGRQHRHFRDFTNSLHKIFKKPAQLKMRLQAYSRKLDRGCYAGHGRP